MAVGPVIGVGFGVIVLVAVLLLMAGGDAAGDRPLANVREYPRTLMRRLWRGFPSSDEPQTLTVTRRNVAGIEVESVAALVFCSLNRAFSSESSSGSRPSAAAAA